jgi:HEAT repeat protein
MYDELLKINNKNVFTEDDFKFLKLCAVSKDWEVRNTVAEILVKSNSNTTKEILVKLCKDQNSLVRTNACDSLAVFAYDDVFDILKKISGKDKCYLVRTYAVMSMYDVGKNLHIDEEYLLKFFAEMVEKEHNTLVKLALFSVMYKCGNRTYIRKIVKCLYCGDYKVRCFAVNILGELKNGVDGDFIKSKIKRLMAYEKSVAVMSTIQRTFPFE